MRDAGSRAVVVRRPRAALRRCGVAHRCAARGRVAGVRRRWRCLSTASVCAHLIQHRLARVAARDQHCGVVGRRAMAAVCGLVGQVHSASAHGSMRPVACLRRTCDAHGMTPPHSVMASDTGRPASERPWRTRQARGATARSVLCRVWAPTSDLRPSITSAAPSRLHL